MATGHGVTAGRDVAADHGVATCHVVAADCGEGADRGFAAANGLADGHAIIAGHGVAAGESDRRFGTRWGSRCRAVRGPTAAGGKCRIPLRHRPSTVRRAFRGNRRPVHARLVAEGRARERAPAAKTARACRLQAAGYMWVTVAGGCGLEWGWGGNPVCFGHPVCCGDFME